MTADLSTRREFLKKAALGSAVLTVPVIASRCKSRDETPNIILINVDDLGWRDLGCYGSGFYETPNIDKLAAHGMRFTDAYAAAAVCSPTRASIMTGKYPARLGITDWIRAEFQGGGRENPEGYTENIHKKLFCPLNPFHLELSEITIAEILKKRGYTTCHIGKWHLGTDAWYPDKQGFDKNIAGCDYGQPPGYFDPYVALPTAWHPEPLKGFPTMEARKKGEYLTDRECDEAVAFIRSNRNRPFFLNLCHYAVHTPLQAKETLIQKYENKPKTEQTSALYAAMVESVDASAGKILQTLKNLKLTEKTIIIFTSDNGGLLTDRATNNYPLRLGKGYPYEGGIRIPLIVVWPGKVEKASQCEEPVISPDLFPTICDMTGADDSDLENIDGVSLEPVLTSKRPLNRKAIFWHFPHYRGSDITPYSIVRCDQWKLIKFYEEPRVELYNLSEDKSETNDLSGALPQKTAELMRMLTDWLQESGAKLPKNNADYVPDNRTSG